jgi:hypothetical protein
VNLSRNVRNPPKHLFLNNTQHADTDISGKVTSNDQSMRGSAGSGAPLFHRLEPCGGTTTHTPARTTSSARLLTTRATCGAWRRAGMPLHRWHPGQQRGSRSYGQREDLRTGPAERELGCQRTSVPSVHERIVVILHVPISSSAISFALPPCVSTTRRGS